MKKKKTSIKAIAKTKRNITEEVVDAKWAQIVNAVVICLMPIVAFFAYEFAFVEDWLLDLPKLFFLAFYGLGFFYLFLLELKKNSFSYYIRVHLYRFTIMFLLCLLTSTLMTILPPYVWPYLMICILLTLCSNIQTATGAFFYLLFYQTLLTGMDSMTFIVFAMIGMLGILLFGNIDQSFHFMVPLFEALLCQTMILVLWVFYQEGRLPIDALLYIAALLVISFIVLVLCLKLLSVTILHKDYNRYQEINDPEYVLLTELKKRNAKEYYHAVHTAYFCEKIARKIGADEMLAKAGGYYHKIGLLRGNKNLKNMMDIATEHRFPPKLSKLLMEYSSKNYMPSMKETAIVIIADAMVSSVSYLYEQDKKAKLDFDRIAKVVFQKQMDSGILKQCDITMQELSFMQKTFVEENLYYDFLR